jgi:RHS repeat-associated protein
VGNPYLFTGREYDPETGLYFYRARTYDPATGRFLQRDPLGYVGGLGLHAYTANSPTSHSDPDGRERTEARSVLNGRYRVWRDAQRVVREAEHEVVVARAMVTSAKPKFRGRD